MINAVKIDVIKKQVYPVSIEEGIAAIYEQLNCTTFEVPVVLENRDGLFVDEEGLLKNPDSLPGAFVYRGFNQVLMGHGLFIGCDEEGESCDVKTTIADITTNVIFVTPEDLRSEHARLNDQPITVTSWPGL